MIHFIAAPGRFTRNTAQAPAIVSYATRVSYPRGRTCVRLGMCRNLRMSRIDARGYGNGDMYYIQDGIFQAILRKMSDASEQMRAKYLGICAHRFASAKTDPPYSIRTEDADWAQCGFLLRYVLRRNPSPSNKAAAGAFYARCPMAQQRRLSSVIFLDLGIFGIAREKWALRAGFVRSYIRCGGM